MSKYLITVSAPATQVWVYEVEASSAEEARTLAQKIADGELSPDPISYEVQDDQEPLTIERIDPE
jgi:hypothetical protein